MYELTAFSQDDDQKEVKACTSIIAQTANGTLYHARNLDYYFPVLQRLTAQVDFMENGKVLYTGTVFVGYVGLLTGKKPNGFSVSLNQRNNGEWWMNLLQAVSTGTHGSASFLT